MINVFLIKRHSYCFTFMSVVDGADDNYDADANCDYDQDCEC